MADAQERLRQLQQSLNNARQNGFKGFPGGGAPRGFFSGIGGLIVLGGGGALLYNSLFNGKHHESRPHCGLTNTSQSMVDTERSSTQE